MRTPLALALGLCLLAAWAPPAPAARPDLAQVEKSVGRVLCFHSNRRVATGSGFVVSREGHFITNNHVIAGNPAKIVVAFGASQQQQFPAKVLWSSKALDLAVLKMEGLSAPPMTLVPVEMVRKGEQTWAIGYPGAADRLPNASRENLFQAKVTNGVVSNITREGSGRRVLQTNAALNPGNSGGPLINDCGQVMGVNTFAPSFSPQLREFIKAVAEGRQPGAIIPPQGISWAVSASEVIQVLQKQGVSFLTASGPCEPSAAGGAAAISPWLYAAMAMTLVVAVLSLVVVLNASRRQAFVQGLARAGQTVGLGALTRSRAGLKGYLQGISGHLGGKEFALGPGPLYLGRDASRAAAVFGADQYHIEPLHAQLRYDVDRDRFELKDLHSKAGTFLQNGRRLRPDQTVNLRSGDRFYLGHPREVFQVASRRGPSQASDSPWQHRPKGVLEGVSGSFQGQEFPLGKEPVVLGRSSSQAAIVFPAEEGQYISRAHAKLSFDEASGLFMLEDLGSTYGTFLAPKQRLQPGVPKPLRPGQVFYLAKGSQAFRIKKE
ncbi:MAG: trypsin-like peptidase domain-containing protein [Thermodesulfobacteriota bacterium]